jgi:hypothetical protein
MMKIKRDKFDGLNHGDTESQSFFSLCLRVSVVCSWVKVYFLIRYGITEISNGFLCVFVTPWLVFGLLQEVK